jgi:glycosyltransferase involved in cell wall biosynthesis
VQVLRIWTTRFGRAHLPGRAIDYLSFYASAFLRLLWLLRKNDTVVAKTDPPLISVVAALAARLKGARLVNWLQDVFPEVATALGVRILSGPLGGVVRRARDVSLSRAEVNVALGETMSARVQALGVPAARVTTIHNWADDRAIVPLPHEHNPLRREWDLEGKFVVAYSGNLGRAHEFDTMLDAARMLERRAEIVFLFIGGGVRADAIRRYVEAHGLTNVMLRPYQPRERLALSLGAGDLHLVSLLPGLEGLIVPSKFYGIAAAGRPVAYVGDAEGEIGRLVQRCDCGRSFTVGDSAGLAEYIAWLATHPAEVVRLGRNARAALEAEFSKVAALGRWEELLARIGLTHGGP